MKGYKEDIKDYLIGKLEWMSHEMMSINM
jgi:hypothetical protein